jgi:hypothetical protein
MELVAAFTTILFINGDSAAAVAAYLGNAGTAFFAEIDTFAIIRLALRAYHGHLDGLNEGYS